MTEIRLPRPRAPSPGLLRRARGRDFTARGSPEDSELSPLCISTRMLSVPIIRDGHAFKRREVKPGRTPPAGFERIETDETTGKEVGWVPVHPTDPCDRCFVEGIRGTGISIPPPHEEIYELVAPRELRPPVAAAQTRAGPQALKPTNKGTALADDPANAASRPETRSRCQRALRTRQSEQIIDHNM